MSNEEAKEEESVTLTPDVLPGWYMISFKWLSDDTTWDPPIQARLEEAGLDTYSVSLRYVSDSFHFDRVGVIRVSSSSWPKTQYEMEYFHRSCGYKTPVRFSRCKDSDELEKAYQVQIARESIQGNKDECKRALKRLREDYCVLGNHDAGDLVQKFIDSL